MIGLDLDGTLLNYGNHTTELRINQALIDQLATLTKEVVILTNQVGLVWHESNPTKYPSPEQFVKRAKTAIDALRAAGIRTVEVHVALFHPKAEEEQIQQTYLKLDAAIVNSQLDSPHFWLWRGQNHRKPGTGMFKATRVTEYYGDSDEDEAAAQAFGCHFVRVRALSNPHPFLTLDPASCRVFCCLWLS